MGADENRRIELDVILSLDDGQGPGVHLVMELDPATHLPWKCQIVGDGAQVTASVRFEYPENGPREVFDVGVPRNVVLQDATLPDGTARVAMLDRTADVEVEVADALDRESVSSSDSALAAETSSEDLGVAEFDPPLLPSPVVVSSQEMSHRIDELMASYWGRHDVSPAALSGDEEFFRRVYLDLTGRIPTVSECHEFQSDTGNDRRQRLTEQLLGRRDHATHLGAVWRKILLPDGVDLSNYGGAASFEEWLSERFRDNMPYDRLVRDLLLAEGRVSESGPILFYTALKLEPEELAAQTSRAFLGMRLECAQCHDHFFDKRWKQTDVWSYAAFFAQISRPEGKTDVVSPVLRVDDTDHGEVTLPDSEDVIAPRYPLGESPGDNSAAIPRREQLASWLTAADNPHFARATVNRVWAHLLGRGLVEPVDDMRIDNPSPCPEVLDELAVYFAAAGFDLRDLFRVIVSTGAYQRTSRSSGDDSSRTMHFAQMNIKTFTAEQLYDSISVATRLEPVESRDGSLMRFQNGGREAFLAQFRAPPGQVTDYHAGIPQALTLMNGGLIHSATDLASSGVLRSLQAPFFSDKQRVDTLFMATLSRRPDDVERQSMLDYVLSDDGERNQRLSDVLWAEWHCHSICGA